MVNKIVTSIRREEDVNLIEDRNVDRKRWTIVIRLLNLSYIKIHSEIKTYHTLSLILYQKHRNQTSKWILRILSESF